jgi:hypothetical protein
MTQLPTDQWAAQMAVTLPEGLLAESTNEQSNKLHIKIAQAIADAGNDLR